MAEIQSQQLQQKHGGVQRAKKLSTRVDLTPMVDLGFLLITFFVFTNTLSKPMVFKLNMPDETGKVIDYKPINENKILILLLENDKKVGYYFGDDVKDMQFTNYGASGLRNTIIQKQAAVTKKYGKPDDLLIVIKPTNEASYANVVAALDEMLITGVSRYMLLDVTAAETSVAIR